MSYEIKKEQFDLTMHREFFFSADNSMKMIVYLSAKRFMERIGDVQFCSYQGKVDGDSFPARHAKLAVKTYKKIKKAIYAIDVALTEKGEYDSILNSKLKRHVDIIWKYRGILWY